MQQTPNTSSLVEVVRQASAISEQTYKDIISEIKQTGASEAAVLSKHGVPSDILTLATKSIEYRTPFIQLEGTTPESTVLEKISPGFAYRNKIVPIELAGDYTLKRNAGTCPRVFLFSLEENNIFLTL